MNFFKKIFRLFFYFFLAVAFLLASASALLYFYKDKVIEVFVAEANKYIKTPVSVQKIDISLFRQFPHVSIVFDKVLIQEAVKGSKGTLASADRLYCSFNLIALLRGDYEVKQIVLDGAEVYLKILPDGKNNFTFIEANPDDKNEDVRFNLQKVKLNNVLVSFSNRIDNQEVVLHAKDLLSSFNMLKDQMNISLNGNLHSKYIKVDKYKFFEEKALHVKSILHVDASTGSFMIRPSRLTVHNAPFSVDGYYSNTKGRHIEINVQAENASFQNIISLLPEKYRKELSQYKSRGNVYFNGQLKGNINRSQLPALKVDFGASGASFYHPDYKQTINDIEMEGSFVCGNLKNMKTARLELNKFYGTLDGGEFSGNLALENFDDLFLKTNLKAGLKVGALLKIFPSKEISSAQGDVQLNIAFQGKVNDLRNKNFKNRLKTSGDFTIRDLAFRLEENSLAFTAFNGNFMFKDNDLAVSNFSGRIGKSNFLLNGFFKNVIPYVLYDGQKIEIEADLKSNFIDFDELLFANKKSTSASSNASENEYSFKISPDLDIRFNCAVKDVIYQRFKARNVKGKVELFDQTLKTRDVMLHTMGGNLLLNSSVNARDNQNIRVHLDSRLERISIDSIFYVFRDFNQQFLTTKNLKGEIFSDIYSSMTFNDKLTLDPAKLIVDAGIIISKGELNDFEPMQNLSRFIKSESLARLRFPELKNNIHIENRTIHIPEMEVRNNVSSIIISGTHTFDQRIDYKLKIPLRGMFRINRPEKDYEHSVGNDGKGGLNLFLTIKGTADDYKVAFDTHAVKNKIKADLGKEKQELKDAFRKKDPKEEKEKVLSEDEYFEF